MIKRRLPKDVYSRCITFLYGTVDELNRTLALECPTDFTPLRASCRGHWKNYPHSGYEADYICLVRTTDRTERLVVLAHEALHCASHALRMAGLPHTEETEEAYTYYQCWLIRQCLQLVP